MSAFFLKVSIADPCAYSLPEIFKSDSSEKFLSGKDSLIRFIFKAVCADNIYYPPVIKRKPAFFKFIKKSADASRFFKKWQQ